MEIEDVQNVWFEVCLFKYNVCKRQQ